MKNRNGILGLIVAIVAALFGGRAIQQRRNAGNGGLLGGLGGQQPGAGSGDLGGLLGGLGNEQPGTGKLRDTEGKPVQEV
jgi:hypothetical protein